MAKDNNKEELWVSWTHDAMARYVIPEDVKTDEELIDDMTNTSVDYADAMLEEYEHRFEDGAKRRRRGKKPDDDDPDND